MGDMSDPTSATPGAAPAEPVAEPVNNAPPAPGTEAPPIPPAEPAAPAATEPTKPEKPADPPWFVKRLNQQNAKIGDLSRQNEQLMALLRAANGAPAAEPPADPGTAPAPAVPQSPADIDRLVNDRAAQIAAKSAFDEACNTAYEAGKSEFKDFEEAVGTLGAVGALGNQSFLEAATGLPDAHKVLHHLGKNPDDAVRISTLPPIAMAAELGRLSASLGAPKPPPPVSKAPDPIVPVVGGSVRVDGAPTSDDMHEWVKWRQQNRRNRV